MRHVACRQLWLGLPAGAARGASDVLHLRWRGRVALAIDRAEPRACCAAVDFGSLGAGHAIIALSACDRECPMAVVVAVATVHRLWSDSSRFVCRVGLALDVSRLFDGHGVCRPLHEFLCLRRWCCCFPWKWMPRKRQAG